MAHPRHSVNLSSVPAVPESRHATGPNQGLLGHMAGIPHGRDPASRRGSAAMCSAGWGPADHDECDVVSRDGVANQVRHDVGGHALRRSRSCHIAEAL
jgi:hypothetical protein